MVMQAIRTAFQPVVEGCRLQILLACHTKLVEPSLTSKQTLNGDLVKKLFHQKSIYVRPDKVILCEDNESTYSDGESSHTSRQDFTETLNSDKCVETSKEVPSAIPIVNTQSMTVDDEVIWCVATQDVCTVESSISADTLTMSTNPSVIATDEDEPYSSGTSASVSYNTPGLSVGSSASVTGDTRVFSSNTSSVSNGPTQPSLSSTSYSTYLGLFEEEYLSDDPDLQEAISRSLDSSASESDVQSLERILEQIVTRVNNDSTVRFNIIRRNVWDGASRAMGRSNFSPEKK
ncbi:uncharacterized protein LOC120440042 [Oreochromis aureus]|nr:uncharacterized protein LOC120440042 [Oreochromis aureus]